MKFAHLADTHLGYRQFGLMDREKDFYEVFEKIIDRIIEEDVDFVIHSGDLFETARPSPNALLAFQKGLLKLKGAGIPMYAIAGNHDSTLRKGAIPPQVIFKKFGLKVISPINTNYMHDDVFIAGLPYFSNSQGKHLKNKLAELSAKAENHEKSILVLHQGIDKYFPFQYELEIGDIPDNFTYYALGHIHNFICDDFGEGKLVYPGSSDIWKTDEIKDFKKNGKGFVIVDLDGPKPVVNRISIDIPREFINKDIDYENLNDELDNIKNMIEGFDKKPILNLNINNVNDSIEEVYDVINDKIGDLALMIRPKFASDEDENELELLEGSRSLSSKELLIEKLEKFEDKSITNFAVDLLDILSKDDKEEPAELISDFYKQHYDMFDIDHEESNSENEKEDDDKQVTFYEVLK